MQFRNLIIVALVGWGVGFGADVAGERWIGVGLEDINAELAKALKLPQETGVEITLVIPGAPAAVAGVKVGDVVVQYNGQPVEDREQFKRMVQDTPAGKEVKLQIYRNGAPQIIVTKTSPRPAITIHASIVPSTLHSQPFPGALPDVPLNRMSWGSGVLGAELESLEGQLADAFGVKDGGVLVRQVTRGLAGDKAGLKAGDVITRVGDVKVTTPADVSGRIRAGREQSATLTVLRDHREISISVALDGARPGLQ